MRSPLGRTQPSVTSPTGSGRPATWRSPPAMASMRASAEAQAVERAPAPCRRPRLAGDVDGVGVEDGVGSVHEQVGGGSERGVLGLGRRGGQQAGGRLGPAPELLHRGGRRLRGGLVRGRAGHVRSVERPSPGAPSRCGRLAPCTTTPRSRTPSPRSATRSGLASASWRRRCGGSTASGSRPTCRSRRTTSLPRSSMPTGCTPTPSCGPSSPRSVPASAAASPRPRRPTCARPASSPHRRTFLDEPSELAEVLLSADGRDGTRAWRASTTTGPWPSASPWPASTSSPRRSSSPPSKRSAAACSTGSPTRGASTARPQPDQRRRRRRPLRTNNVHRLDRWTRSSPSSTR